MGYRCKNVYIEIACVCIYDKSIKQIGGITVKKALIKATAGVTALIMSGALTACAGAPASSVSQATDTSTAVEAEKNLHGFAEPVTLKVGYAWPADFQWLNGETSADNVWVDLYKENNIFLDILYEVDSSQGDTKLSTAIMSGNYPDIMTLNASQLSDYANFAATGVIADITDAFEMYASDELKEYVNVDGGKVMDSLKIDGRLYGLPRMSNAYDSAALMFIRQDWLDKLNLEMPTTMDELKTVAHAFTYDDPDGNGADDTYGIAIDGMNVFTGGMGDANALFYAYGAYPGDDALAFVQGEDGKVTWGGTNADGMKAGLSFLQDLYKDGSLAKDFITMNSDAVFQEAGAGRCGIWFGPMWGNMQPSTDLLIAGFTDSRITSAPIPSGQEGEEARALLKSAPASVFVASAQCKTPEALVEMMNLIVQKLCHPANEEEYNKYYGVAQKTTGWKSALTPLSGAPLANYDTYKAVSVALEKRDPSGLSLQQATYYNNITKYLDTLEAGTLDMEDSETRSGVQRYAVFGDKLGSYAALDQLIKADQFTYSAYNTVPSDKMAEYAPTLKKLTAETVVKIITGENVDNYDKFLENWYVLGGTEVIADAQAWVDEK